MCISVYNYPNGQAAQREVSAPGIAVRHRSCVKLNEKRKAEVKVTRIILADVPPQLAGICKAAGYIRADIWRRYGALGNVGKHWEITDELVENTYGYLYLTTNTITGRQYIGQKKGAFELSYYGSGTAIKHAIKKYGTGAFQVDVIIYCASADVLDWCESQAIESCDAVNSDDYYNLALGGRTPRHTEQTKGKISHAMAGELNHQYGVKHSLERRLRASGEGNPMYGRRGDKSHVFGVTGENHPAFGNSSGLGKNNPMYGKKHTDEARAKMREASSTKRHTSRKGIKHSRVVCHACEKEMAKSTFTKYHAEGKCVSVKGLELGAQARQPTADKPYAQFCATF